MSDTTALPKPHVGLLLVHGIGEQAPGEFLRDFRDGLGDLPGVQRVVDTLHDDPAEPGRQIHAASIEFADRTWSLYEVHWADLIGDEIARAAFDPEQLFLLAWFPWFNKQYQLPGFDRYPRRRVAAWTLLLVPLSVLFFLGYVGLTSLPHFWRGREAVDVLSDRCGHRWQRRRRRQGKDEYSLLDQLAKKNEERLHKYWVEGRAERNRHRLTQAVARTWFDRLLDGYLGDVANFVTSMARLPRLRSDLPLAREFGGEVPTDVFTASLPQDRVQAFVDVDRRERDIMQLAERASGRFDRTLWIAAAQDHCTEIQVLAHSLGSLVAYNALNRAPDESPAGGGDTGTADLTRLHTIGSPLEKIHFFWPLLVAPRGSRPFPVAHAGDGRRSAIRVAVGFQWINYFSVSDKVSGALRRFAGWGAIHNRRLAGLGGVLSAHVAYKQNPALLAALAVHAGITVPPRRIGSLQSATAWAWSALQALALPLGIAAVCLLGVGALAAFSALVAAIPTALASVVGWAGRSVWSGVCDFVWYTRMFNWLTAISFGSSAMLIALLVPIWAKAAARASVRRWWRRLGGRPSTADASAA